ANFKGDLTFFIQILLKIHIRILVPGRQGLGVMFRLVVAGHSGRPGGGGGARHADAVGELGYVFLVFPLPGMATG
ncbi:hypothetical protein, partial [Serratia proteamaculans]|uniref:hypothetical protein n=1 Tax=Serratia proteamaculans TaxID=28151 RepID=UPI003D003622